MAQGYRQQYGLKMAYLVPANLYGPRDNFDPDSSHVIPALIRKYVDAKEAGADHITVWGSGQVCRKFLYVGGAAEGIVRASERYEGPDPVNLGTGEEITVENLVLEKPHSKQLSHPRKEIVATTGAGWKDAHRRRLK